MHGIGDVDGVTRTSPVRGADFALIVHLYGFVYAEAAAGGSPPPGEEPSYPHLSRYAPGVDPTAMDERFRYGVRRLLAGLTACR
jgi:hypothetical protein